MQFDDSNLDTSQLEDRRGGGGGGMGGMVGAGAGRLGIIGVIIAIIYMFMGGDPSTVMVGTDGTTTTSGSSSQTTQDIAATCKTQQDIMNNDACFVLKTFNETNEVWQQNLQGYTNPKLVYYSGGTQTGGCGSASSNAGPFYCPADQKVYIDLNFLNQLQKQYGLPGRNAQAYIVAHEVGHHIQQQTGIEAKVRKLQQQNPSQANALSVKMELQADCLAGVWARKANDNGNVRITQDEYNQALVAAAAVGDDAIMSSAGMRVNQEKFTHGSSAQRQQWFTTGFSTGDANKCNTFG